MRNKEEIHDEIEKLLEAKPKVPQFSLFNEDNHALIEVAIRILSTNKSEDIIYEMYGHLDDPGMLDSALNARHWLDEMEGYPAPSADWEHFV